MEDEGEEKVGRGGGGGNGRLMNAVNPCSKGACMPQPTFHVARNLSFKKRAGVKISRLIFSSWSRDEKRNEARVISSNQLQLHNKAGHAPM
jgi:hypothetical protein